MDQQFKKFWETENFGIEGADSRTEVMSEEDRRATEIVR